MRSRRHRSVMLAAMALGAALLVASGPAVGVSGAAPARGGHPAATTRDTDGDGLPDGFETAAGLDPLRRDTDGDGLRDPAEDLDGDGLSNLGEQRFHTDPLLSDTDADGTPDGAEDSDGDGIRDGREQDRRPVPSHLRPAVGAAYGDSPRSYRDGCHLALGSTAFRVCTYGDRGSATRVVLFGDSHAAQWLPALSRAGERSGWAVVSFTRSGCPFAVVKVHRRTGSDVPCERWRQRVLRWIRVRHPAAVVMSSLARYWLIESSLSWSAGLRRAVGAMPADTVPLVLADTPNLKVDVPACLRANPGRISACTRPRSAATHWRWRRREEQVAVAVGARYGDLTSLVCPYDPCPAVVDDLLLWRDGGHLTRTYSQVLTPSVEQLVRDALAPPPPPPPDPARRSRSHR